MGLILFVTFWILVSRLWHGRLLLLMVVVLGSNVDWGSDRPVCLCLHSKRDISNWRCCWSCPISHQHLMNFHFPLVSTDSKISRLMAGGICAITRVPQGWRCTKYTPFLSRFNVSEKIDTFQLSLKLFPFFTLRWRHLSKQSAWIEPFWSTTSIWKW